MRVSYDLHIHTVLSSCADDSMTPNNIFNMVMLKELDMIAICDHNSGKQYKTLELLKESYDYLLIYGMEIQVKEGFHVLSYFENIDDLTSFDQEIALQMDHSLPPFGEQIICDEYDQLEDIVPYDLHQSIYLDFKETIELIRKYHGIVVLAHINRGKTGILNTYKDFSNYDIDAIEIYDKSNEKDLEEKYPYIKKYRYLYNSDSHSVVDINEAINFMELDDVSFKSFKKYLKDKK